MILALLVIENHISSLSLKFDGIISFKTLESTGAKIFAFLASVKFDTSAVINISAGESLPSN